MKNLTLLLITAAGLVTFTAQAQLTGITPNQGHPGQQNFTTTITSANIFIAGSSPSGNLYQIYLHQGTNNYFLFNFNNLLNCCATVVHPDTVVVTDVDIPSGAPLGAYDLYVIIGDVMNPTINQFTYIMPSAFTVTPPDGYIEGTTYFDINNNGVKDAADPVMPNHEVTVLPNNGVYTSTAAGEYSIPVYNGTYVVSYVPDPSNYLVVNSNPASHTVTINNNTDNGNDFGLIKSLISMAPNQSYQNFTTNITITAHGIFEVLVPQQGNITDIYVKYASTEYHAPYSSINVIDSNTATATISIPVVAPMGSYYLYVKTDGVNTHWLPNAFSVVDYPYNVSGNVYFDINANGIKDGSDYGLPFQRIYITPHNNYYFTDNQGDYLIGTPAGITVVTWSPIAGSNLVLTSDSASYTLNVSSNVSNLDFGVNSSNANYTSDIVFTSGIPRCFQDVNYTVNYSNQSNIATNGYVMVKKDPLMTFVSSVPAPSNISGDTLFWNYTNLPPLLQNTIAIVFHMPGPNTALNSYASIVAVDGGGNTIFTGMAVLSQNTACSYDPNDKSVIPEGAYVPHYTLMSDTLEYLIRFQNTGNDTAFNVTVIDYLDSDFDYSTFELIACSHSVLSELRNNGELRFTFNNILLPDSNVNEPASHGFIKYRIRAKSGLSNYTNVQNAAYIVFDLNAPVVTNTTWNTLVYVIPVSIIEQVKATGKAVVYPNPFSDAATIIFKNEEFETFNLCLRDINGSVVFTQSFMSDRIQIQKGSLTQGIYFFELNNADYSVKHSGKFVIR